MTSQEFLTGAYGATCLKTTNVKTGKFCGFIVWSDAVISELKLKDKATNTEVTVNLASEGLDVTTIPAGATFVPPYGHGFYISSITLASGIIYLLRS